MTVSSTINREQYATDGVATAFAIHFSFFHDTDVRAAYVGADGVATPMALNADYTVSGGGGAGGMLTTKLAPESGGALTIYREIPFTQEDDYVEDDPLPADTLEGGFDRAVMRDQQLKDSQDRALTFPPTIAPGVSAVLPTPVADTFLGWNATGDALENKQVPAGAVVYASLASTNAGLSPSEALSPLQLANSDLAAETHAATAGIAALSALTGRNRIINGRMDVWQRGYTFAPVLSGAYCADRFCYNCNTKAVGAVAIQSDGPSNTEFQNSLRYTVTTADAAMAAGEFACIEQRIEGFNVRDLIGRAFTLSFWLRSSKTGIHCVAFRNSGGGQCYVAEYTVNAANVWEKKIITLPAGLVVASAGWDWGNGAGMRVAFTLAAGSSYQTAANSWQAGTCLATVNQVNCLDTVNNIFAITGVQLEVGSTATAFEHRSIQEEITRCERYYQKSFAIATPPATGGGSGIGYVQTGNPPSLIQLANVPFRGRMRATPTITLYNPAAANALLRNLALNADFSSTSVNFVNETGFSLAGVPPAGSVAGQTVTINWAADAEL